ncbi:hypothetical protein [Streptomyces sp. H27-C3]|uniref:hypothetical protein n=1 Tax=Streptomyces sp. H27-C3 TaxID=3046305 RepID=UPI0024BB5382|nr:hypothetical protein [Streptomyces sp. H27-C3]MDJ0461926.1 hypothetical protein [Streptomyces sp. H27-C3]
MSKGIRRLLRDAADEHRRVRVHRSLPGADSVEGFVVAAKGSWTLIAECQNVQLDGFVAIRTDDIVRIDHRGRQDVTARWLRGNGPWPPPAPRGRISLKDARALAESAAGHYGLIGVYEEDGNPDSLYIGALADSGGKVLRLLEVCPKARWAKVRTKYRYADITRIDFGDRYQAALAGLAGPRPGR